MEVWVFDALQKSSMNAVERFKTGQQVQEYRWNIDIRTYQDMI